MIYQLLNDLKRYWSDKESLAPEEKEMLQRLTKALPAMLCEQSCEQLAPGEVLVRICPDTRRQVLVCHNGDGQCVCLHNGTIEEDAAAVSETLPALMRVRPSIPASNMHVRSRRDESRP